MISQLALYRPVPYKGLAKRTGKAAVILHTNGAPAGAGGDLYAYWSAVAASGSTLGAHFQINSLTGFIWQYVDTDYVLGHAWDANPWAIGIETEDGGDSTKPWSGPQVDAIVALCEELGVPGVALLETPSDGVGYHRQYASWNKSGHTCPGDARQAQIATIIAQLQEGEGMALNGNELNGLAYLFGQQRRVKGNPVPTTYTASDGQDRLAAAVAGWNDKDAEIAARKP